MELWCTREVWRVQHNSMEHSYKNMKYFVCNIATVKMYIEICAKLARKKNMVKRMSCAISVDHLTMVFDCAALLAML